MFKAIAFLDADHDISEVMLNLNYATKEEATNAFHHCMKQLGFKRSDYGHVHVERYDNNEVRNGKIS